MLKDILPKSIVIRTDLGCKSLEPYSLHSKPLTVHNSRSRMHWSKSNNDLEVNDEIWNCFRFNFLLANVQKPQIIFPAKKYYPNFFGLNNLYHNKESAKLVNHKTKRSQTFNLSYFFIDDKKETRNAFHDAMLWLILIAQFNLVILAPSRVRIWYKSSIFYEISKTSSSSLFPIISATRSDFLQLTSIIFFLAKNQAWNHSFSLKNDISNWIFGAKIQFKIEIRKNVWV